MQISRDRRCSRWPHRCPVRRCLSSTARLGLLAQGWADHLTAAGITGLVIVGGAANYCVESTARMAGNLGYATTVVGDALINFRQRLRDGREMAAGDVLALTLANLDGEFAHIASVNEILTQVAS